MQVLLGETGDAAEKIFNCARIQGQDVGFHLCQVDYGVRLENSGGRVIYSASRRGKSSDPRFFEFDDFNPEFGHDS